MKLLFPTGSPSNRNPSVRTQTLLKYEIMDGAPVKGEVIPVRLYLAGIPQMSHRHIMLRIIAFRYDTF